MPRSNEYGTSYSARGYEDDKTHFQDEKTEDPASNYPSIMQEIRQLDTTGYGKEKAWELTGALHEMSVERAPRNIHFSGKTKSLDMMDHSGNAWPGKTWLLNEDPREKSVNPLNIHNYHRHLLRSADNRQNLNENYHQTDYGLIQKENILREQAEESYRQGVDFHNAALEILDGETDPELRAQAAAAFARLVTGPAREALESIGHETDLTSPEEHREQLEKGLTGGVITTGQAGEIFLGLRAIVDYSERLDSLRAPDPHTMYTAADRQREHRENNREQEAGYAGDPAPDHRYDPATVELLRWAAKNGELSQWTEATLTGQSQKETEETVERIALEMDRTIERLSEPPDPAEKIENSLARWAEARGLLQGWTSHFRAEFEAMEDTGAPTARDSAEDWLDRYNKAMNEENESKETERKRNLLHNIITLTQHSQR